MAERLRHNSGMVAGGLKAGHARLRALALQMSSAFFGSSPSMLYHPTEAGVPGIKIEGPPTNTFCTAGSPDSSTIGAAQPQEGSWKKWNSLGMSRFYQMPPVPSAPLPELCKCHFAVLLGMRYGNGRIRQFGKTAWSSSRRERGDFSKHGFRVPRGGLPRGFVARLG